MRAYEALIAWTPLDYDQPTRGQVRVGPLVLEDSLDWTEPYSHTAGAALVRRRELRGSDSIKELFRDFHYLVVEEALEPQVVHEAFMAIDEYAEMFQAEADDQGLDDANRT